ncbi:LysE/ArgO family amino acid transporter [Paenibacillus sp. 7541]|uniref:LysE/ArgO family amino acid transporter n=1 Tax=Paenibacillus TaxID=44249 RepID=UPI000BA58608|nr:LysE/ArgO family amino acid transporter [Paenibacillus sp. 7541]PAK55662.1 lysine transporter LysE [Paenibacillus sp. 7541]
MLQAMIHGLILAFGLILPLGVQNVFVFNQGAVQPNFSKALPVILTAALCDTLLITLAIMGVSVVVLELEGLRVMLFLFGILFLIYMGVTTWRSKPSSLGEEKRESLSPGKQVAFAMSVSLLNPHAILDTIGVIGTSSLTYSGADKTAFALACITISWLWFIGLGLAGRAAGRLDRSGKVLSLLNRVSAIVMWGTAGYLAYSMWMA